MSTPYTPVGQTEPTQEDQISEYTPGIAQSVSSDQLINHESDSITRMVPAPMGIPREQVNSVDSPDLLGMREQPVHRGSNSHDQAKEANPYYRYTRVTRNMIFATSTSHGLIPTSMLKSPSSPAKSPMVATVTYTPLIQTLRTIGLTVMLPIPTPTDISMAPGTAA